MSWLGLWQSAEEGAPHGAARGVFDPRGLLPQGSNGSLLLTAKDALLPRGSLVLEFCPSAQDRPVLLLHFQGAGDWPFELTIWALPDGAVTVALEQYGAAWRWQFAGRQMRGGRSQRLTLVWDAPTRFGRLSLDRLNGQPVETQSFAAPKPWRLQDLALAFDSTAPAVQRASQLSYLALSDEVEPVGPLPGIDVDMPVLTNKGLRRLGQLRRGDVIATISGAWVPVLQVVTRQMPACGAFAPVWLQSPYFGLSQPLCLARGQRLLMSGSLVEYNFGAEAALVAAGDVRSRFVAAPDADTRPWLVTYGQLVLPDHETPVICGVGVESLWLGRLRRHPEALLQSALAHVSRSDLPEHGAIKYPTINAFDAAVLFQGRRA